MKTRTGGQEGGICLLNLTKGPVTMAWPLKCGAGAQKFAYPRAEWF